MKRFVGRLHKGVVARLFLESLEAKRATQSKGLPFVLDVRIAPSASNRFPADDTGFATIRVGDERICHW